MLYSIVYLWIHNIWNNITLYVLDFWINYVEIKWQCFHLGKRLPSQPSTVCHFGWGVALGTRSKLFCAKLLCQFLTLTLTRVSLYMPRCVMHVWLDGIIYCFVLIFNNQSLAIRYGHSQSVLFLHFVLKAAILRIMCQWPSVWCVINCVCSFTFTLH